MKIFHRYFIILFILSIVPLLVLSGLYFTTTQNEIHQRSINQLQSVGSIQKERVKTVLNSYQNKLDLISGRFELRQYLYDHFNNSITNTSEQVITIINDAVKSDSHVLEISILNTSGFILSSTNSSKINRTYTDDSHIVKGNQTSVVTEFFIYNQSLSSNLVKPLYVNSTKVGLIWIIYQTNELVGISQDYDGLGNSGETLVAKQDKDGNAIFLTSLRFDSDASMQRKVDSSADDIPITQALQGNEVVMNDAIDYRGVKVIAVTRYIEDYGIGIVVKIDKAELRAPIIDLFYRLFAILVIISIISAFAIRYSVNTIILPIKDLNQLADEVAAGNHDRRASITGPKEIKELKQAINSMIEAVSQNKLLHQREEELKRVNEELEQFAYITSHDLQEPLRVLQGFVELMIREVVEEGKTDNVEYFETTITRSVNKLQQMIDDILEFSRIGRMNVRPEPIDLNDVITEVRQSLKLKIDENDVDLRVSELPIIVANYREMVQVFQNLIDNAIKYRSDDRLIVEISSLDDRVSEFHFTVEDNGIGVEEEFVDKIFKPFKKLHSNTKYPGTGIGLAICEKIVTSNGGEIWVEAKEQGSIFHWTIAKQNKD